MKISPFRYACIRRGYCDECGQECEIQVGNNVLVDMSGGQPVVGPLKAIMACPNCGEKDMPHPETYLPDHDGS